MIDDYRDNQHHQAHGHTGEGHDVAGDMTALLDLDGEVLHDYWSAALDWVTEAAAGTAGKRLLDLGAGTGTGAIGLARRFPDAEVIAVDVEPGSLQVLRHKAGELGLAQRVSAMEADLDGGWPDLGVLDLTWASMSLHHLADPGRVLGDVLNATSPTGLIAVAEFSQALRFLPDDLGFGRPGMEARLAEVLGRAHAEVLPTLGSAWAPRLAEAGWNVTAERDFPIDLNPATHPDAARYARAWFERLAHGLTDVGEPGDRATLAALLDPDGPRSLLRRTDLHIRGVRTITVARRC
jgi:ubiquinone/menaquinone biosynthesis C-methylase UbiE